MAFFPPATSHNPGALSAFFGGQKTKPPRSSSFGWLISSFGHNY